MMREVVVRRGGFKTMLFGADERQAVVPTSLRKYLVELSSYMEMASK